MVNGAPDLQGGISPIYSTTAQTIDDAVRGTTITDDQARVISNLAPNQTGVGRLRIIDNHRLNGNLRLSPLTGTVHPPASTAASSP